VSVVVPAPESSHRSDIDLSDAALPIGAGGEAIPMLVAATMLRGETGEELCFFVQVLDAEASPSAPLPPALEHQPVVDFSMADEALATTRSLAWSLRGSVSPRDGLSASLRSLAQTIRSRTGLSVVIDDELDTRFAVRVEAAVYKIVEEALTNVMRHASARSVTISLDHGGGTLTVVIADDGDGFEPDHRALTPGSGMGLLCMEERARLLDGTVRIQSAPGQRTVVKATLAVPPEVRR
jgi:signal transduction histidine kinase